MPDILHRVTIKSPSPGETYKALTTPEGLAGWWTTNTELGGDAIHFRFGENENIDMKVLDQDPDRRVALASGRRPTGLDRHQGRLGPSAGRRLDGRLVQARGLAASPCEFMHACTTKWGLFLMSLKSLVETGKGAPWPNDVKVQIGH